MLTLDASSVKAMNDYLFVFCHISLSAGSYHFQRIFRFTYILSYCFLSVFIFMYPFCLLALWLCSLFLFVITFLHLFYFYLFFFLLCVFYLCSRHHLKWRLALNQFFKILIKFEWRKWLFVPHRPLFCLLCEEFWQCMSYKTDLHTFTKVTFSM